MHYYKESETMTHLTDMAIQVAATKLVPFSYGSFEMQVDENNERVQPAYQPNARALQAAKEVLIAAIPYLNLSPAEPVDQSDLSWLNSKTNFEVSHDCPEGGDESDEGVWKIHSVNGGRSDREWTLVAEDSNLSTAIAKARNAVSAPTSKGDE